MMATVGNKLVSLSVAGLALFSTAVCFPAEADAAASPVAMVVLPTPPFCETIVTIFNEPRLVAIDIRIYSAISIRR